MTASKKNGAEIQELLPKNRFEYDVAIVGGFGHVGLPLGIAFAHTGLKTVLYDINAEMAEQIGRGEMPFVEYGAEPLLKETLQKTLFLSLDKKVVSKARHVVIAIGTPVDEYLSPKTRVFMETMLDLQKQLSRDQTIIIRSTVFPRTIAQLSKMYGTKRGSWPIAYCPERIAQGYAIQELKDLPQIVSAVTDDALESAAELFGKLSPKIIKTSVQEAELVKLFSNAWRYIQFAVSNQFYMICEQYGVDFNSVRKAMTEGYGRAASLPTAGFAAGPCLLKDTMQLAAFNAGGFQLGQAAMMINEGLPSFVVNQLASRFNLSKTRVGILGMAFKGDVDDIRDSLAYKVGKCLRFYGATVFYSDEFAKDPTFVTKERLLDFSEVVIIGAPHSAYKHIQWPSHVEVVDLWGIIQKAMPAALPTISIEELVSTGALPHAQ